MPMVHSLRCPGRGRFACRARVAGRWVAAMLTYLVAATSTLSQTTPEVHYRYHGVATSPGAIGSQQLQRGGPLRGYFQPVEITAPPGALVSLATAGDFSDLYAAPLHVGLLIAPVYRLRVTNIPRHEGLEVFPTIELVNRLYPPAGQARKFPVPIELTQEDLELALAGKFVTRVIYLEDPQHALPARLDQEEQNWFDAGPSADPLQVADELGRPIAILCMGGRLPIEDIGPDEEFAGECPPWIMHAPPVRFEVIEAPVVKKTDGQVKLVQWLSNLWEKVTK